MDIQEVRNDPAYHISYNPAFLIVKEGEDCMFYNSNNHKAFRLSTVEFELLNLLYTYEDRDYVFSLFDGDIKTEVMRIAQVVDRLGMIAMEKEQDCDKTDEAAIPSTFYIHLTHKCNLNCSYCYNQEWRKNGRTELSYNEWNVVVSKIIPYVETVVLTGGEFLLVPFVPKLLESLKKQRPQVIIEGLSNGCLDYSKEYIQEAIGYLDKITLSCDSLNDNDERIGFDKAQFLANLSLIREYFPKVKIAIATTITTKNHMAIDEVKELCDKYGLEWKKTSVCPSSAKDTMYMVELEQQVNNIRDLRSRLHKTKTWLTKQTRCGAAKTVCSIDAMGNVYPCQALHYEPFLMGNLLISEVKELKYINDSSNVIPTVDDLMPCKICKVRYICGGGCFANRYAYNKTGQYSALFCPTRYENSLSMLLSLDNREAN